MSDFLFAIPSFIDGASSVIDLFGVYPEYNISKNPQSADKRAFTADINALKNDASIAFNSVTSNLR
ncbi:MAG: hypothetical protein ACRC5H_03955 [Treponemataceae bacterium]